MRGRRAAPLLVAAVAAALVVGAPGSGTAELRHVPGDRARLYGAYLDFLTGPDDGALEEVLRLRGETSFLVFEQAWVAARRGDQRRMLERAERAVELDGENAEARQLLARTYFRLVDAGLDAQGGFLERGLRHGEALVRQERVEPEVAERLAAAHAQAAREAEARLDVVGARERRTRQAAALRAWARSTGDPVAWSRLAELAMEIGDESGEIEALQAELARAPGNPIVVQRLAELLQGGGRCEEAIPLLVAAQAGGALDVYAAISINVYLGECALDVGRLDLAESALREALERDPTSLVAARQLARALWRQGRRADAVATWDLVASRISRPAAVEDERARWELDHDLHAEAEAHAREALAAAEAAGHDERDRADRHVLLAECLRARGDFPAAEAEARRALELQPAHDDASRFLAIVAWDGGRRAEALAGVRASAAATDDPAAQHRLGQWLLAHGMVDEGLESLQGALARARTMVGLPARRLAALERAAAIVMLDAGRPVVAEAAVRASIARAADSLDATLLLADTLAAQGRTGEARQLAQARESSADRDGLEQLVRWELSHRGADRAVELARRVRELAIGSGNELVVARAAGLLGEAELAARRPEAALSLLREWAAAASHPDPERASLVATALERAGRPREGVPLLQQAVELRPDNVALALQLARLLVLVGRPDEGIALAERIAREHRVSPLIPRQVALVLGDAGERAAALRVVAAALVVWPGHAGLELVLGSLQERQGELAVAEASFRRAMKAEPESPTAWNHLGYLLAERGQRLPEAERLIRRALALRPHEAAYLDSLGWVLFRRGRLAAAEEALEAAVARDRDPVIVMHLGTLREHQGREEEALVLYREALRFGLSEDVSRVESRVEELAALLETAR